MKPRGRFQGPSGGARPRELYFDAMWQMTTDYLSMRQSKHVYVGETRVATRCNIEGQRDVGYEELNTYYYHGDHLGSAQMVTSSEGEVYEHMEYTPYGELWIEATSESTSKTPFRFTGKELDEETGLYYYGARYLNPKTSRWISGDPSLESYLPVAPTSDEGRKKNGNLPGMGGVFNSVNLAVYHYAGNNPVRFDDPNGTDVGDKSFYSSYNRGSAVIYALQWAHGRNPAYDMRKGPNALRGWDDCANYASQILHAGGIQERAEWRNSPGTFSSLGKRVDNNFTESWTTAPGLANWLRSDPTILGGESTVSRGSFADDLSIAASQTKVGDLVGWSHDASGESVHHMGVVTKVENGQIYYSGHTNDRQDQLLDVATMEAADKSAIIFHIKDDAK